MTLHKLPLFAWAIFVTAVLLLLSLPVLAGKFLLAQNLTVCWKLFIPFCLGGKGKIDNQQVTYKNSKSIRNLNGYALNPVTNEISSYLAGLIEGDGTIIVPKTSRSVSGKLNYASIQIAFAGKDFPLITYLNRYIGHGSILKVRKSNAYMYVIKNLEGQIKVINLVNGLFRTPKIKDLHLLIDYVNMKQSSSISKLSLDTTSLFNNAWLSGFIDADGSFQVRTSLKSKYTRLACSFELEQTFFSKHGISILPIMESIALLLNVKVNKVRLNRKSPLYRIRSSTVTQNNIIIQYLKTFPLKSSKYLDFQDWMKIVKYFEEKTHKINVSKIVELKLGMNNNRIYFNWDHLLSNR